MDSLNKIASELESLQPSLKRLQESPQRRKQMDATAEEVERDTDFGELEDLVDSIVESSGVNAYANVFNLVMAAVICASLYLRSQVEKNRY